MNRERYWLVLIGIVICVSAGAYFLYEKSTTRSSPASVAGSQTPSKSDIGSSSKTAIPAKTTTASVPLQQSPANKFLEAKNIDSYIKDLQSDPSKKAELALAKAKAIEECAAFGRSPNYAADRAQAIKSLNKGNPEIVDRYARESSQRCSDFAASGPMKRAEATQLYAEAALAGSPQASAHQLTQQLLHASDAPVADLLNKSEDLINSGDPAAVFELSNAFGTNSKFSGMAVGSEKTAAAWQLVACDMGLDCSQDSALLAEFCLNGGIYCDGGDLRLNMQNSQFSPTDFSEVLALEDEINKQRSSGNTGLLFK